ncbi:hypothetical protein [Verrucosispora sioxanthis]|uniref:hypothetical protein n=1 Tax=Verrucosispora sioxanthis TaxID=2499994 RepID=UPI00209D51C9|nr:hypothetical protein [Verrucosispora sioxanthis]
MTVTLGRSPRSCRRGRRRRHAAELRAVTMALAEVWAELDRRFPPGSDPALTRLRAAHTQLLAD